MKSGRPSLKRLVLVAIPIAALFVAGLMPIDAASAASNPCGANYRFAASEYSNSWRKYVPRVSGGESGKNKVRAVVYIRNDNRRFCAVASRLDNYDGHKGFLGLSIGVATADNPKYVYWDRYKPRWSNEKHQLRWYSPVDSDIYCLSASADATYNKGRRDVSISGANERAHKGDPNYGGRVYSTWIEGGSATACALNP